MKKVFFIIFIIAINLSVYSQLNKNLTLTEKSELSKTEFLIAKQAYLKMSYSEDYKKKRETIIAIAVKIGINKSFNSIANFEEFEIWIKENIQYTKFKSIDEAKDLMKLSFDLEEKLEIDYPDAFKYLKKASREQLTEIVEPDFYDYSDRETILKNR